MAVADKIIRDLMQCLSREPCKLSKALVNMYLPANVSSGDFLKVYYPLLFIKARVRIKPRIPGIADEEYRLFILPSNDAKVVSEAYGVSLNTPFESDMKHVPDDGFAFLNVEYLKKTGFIDKAFTKARRTIKNIIGDNLTIYYVTRINKYSRPGESLQEFKRRIQDDLEGYVRAERERIESTYNTWLKEVKQEMREVEIRLKEAKRLLRNKRSRNVKKGFLRKSSKEEEEDRTGVDISDLYIKLSLLRKEYTTLRRERDREVNNFYSRRYPRIKILNLRISEEDVKILVPHSFMLWVPLGLEKETLIPKINLYSGDSIKGTCAWKECSCRQTRFL
ncbi:MAG: hypothetical protein DRJ41_00520 [Thermoprotei archaeon]|nr:MAG: hypothetical protein DRJ41_00520 [Thermoprotei archaeon]